MARRYCWVAFTFHLEDDCEYRADGKPDRIHVGFSRNWLTKAPTGPKLTGHQANDPRITRPGCRKHHHRLDFGSLKLSRLDIPQTVEDFAKEHGLEARLDRDYGPREAS